MLITSDSLWAGIEASRTLMNGFSHMLRHSLLNENARALPVGALATYALRTFNGTNEKYRSLLAILQNSPTYFHARYLSTLLGLKSEF